MHLGRNLVRAVRGPHALFDPRSTRGRYERLAGEPVAAELEDFSELGLDRGDARIRVGIPVGLDQLKVQPGIRLGHIEFSEYPRDPVKIIGGLTNGDGSWDPRNAPRRTLPVSIHVGIDEVNRLVIVQMLQVEGSNLELRPTEPTTPRHRRQFFLNYFDSSFPSDVK